ncbi:receptor like protein 9 [Abeliophyllum distichum]|uniref:Receptor like protein 9 n=1 Tax=Abeliophyllum distichum TaxID=126358 RepID=A0ABD1PDZ8_9LAMI
MRDNDLHFGGIPNSIHALSNLRVLLLGSNHLNGSILNQILYVLLSTYIVWTKPAIGTYGNFLVRTCEKQNADYGYTELVEVEFVTKGRPGCYNGDILNYMSGLNLSCNNLIGEVPPEIGYLSSIHVANLSYNHLTSSIPKT